MFRWQIHKSEDTLDGVCKLKEAFNHADAIIIGAGAGLSTSAGLSYSGERFHKYFYDFAEKYPIQDMYSGGFYPFDTLGNIGPGGVGIFGSTVIWMRQSRYITSCTSW